MADQARKPNVGFIGIGLMGKPMTQRLLAAGYRTRVWNRSRAKLKDVVASRGKNALEKEFGFRITGDIEQNLGELLIPAFAENQFENIVRFMSGRAPAECTPEEARASLE